MELFLKYPHEVQDELLFSLIKSAENTQIGRKYDFSSMKNYTTFSERIPVSTYEELEPLIELTRKGEQNVFWNSNIKWFAKSSGTTNAKSKFIPVSSEALENCHYKASKDLLCLFLNNNEDSQLFTGKSLRLGGSKQLYEDNNTFFGDLSAILIDNMPIWAEFSSTPSSKISLMGDWETKLPAIINETMNENVTSLAGVPSWMMVLLQKTLETTGKSNLLELWPNAEVYFHGGVSFEPYKEQYKKLFPKDSFKYYEIYNASEGFFAIQDQNDSDELLLMLDYGIFYEFIPMDTFGTLNQRVIRLNQVELHKNYALVITTNSGLWRYLIGDTLRFTDLKRCEIIITGRTKHFLSLCGEHLSVDNMNQAIKLTAKDLDLNINEYCVVGKPNRGLFAHHWYVGVDKETNETLVKEKIDGYLKQLNDDYATERNHALNEVIVTILPNQAFIDFLASKNKLGGQSKFPRVLKGKQLNEWMAFLETYKK